MPNPLKKIASVYIQGFRSMTLGKTLWKIIIIKLIIIFCVIKVYICPDYLHTRFTTDRERAEHVFAEITAAETKH